MGVESPDFRGAHQRRGQGEQESGEQAGAPELPCLGKSGEDVGLHGRADGQHRLSDSQDSLRLIRRSIRERGDIPPELPPEWPDLDREDHR